MGFLNQLILGGHDFGRSLKWDVLPVLGTALTLWTRKHCATWSGWVVFLAMGADCGMLYQAKIYSIMLHLDDDIIYA